MSAVKTCSAFVRTSFFAIIISGLFTLNVLAKVGRSESSEDVHFLKLTSSNEKYDSTLSEEVTSTESKISLPNKPLSSLSKSSFPLSTNAVETDDPCKPEILSTGTMEHKVSAIETLDTTCLSGDYWNKSDFTQSLYNEEFVLALIERIEEVAGSYDADPNSGMLQLIQVSRAALYVADDDFNFSYDTVSIRTALTSALKAIAVSDGWLDQSAYHAEQVMYEWLIHISNTQLQVELFPELIQLLDDIAEHRLAETQWLENAWRVFYVLSHRVPSGDEMENTIAADDQFLERVRFWSTNRYILALAEWLPHRPFYWLSRVGLGYDAIKDDAKTLFIELLEEYPVDSPWFISLIDGDAFRAQCAEIAPAYCPATYKDSLKARLFPNTYSFDGGKFVVKTALDESQAQQLFSAAQQVKAQFFQLTQNTTPVADDTNETLTMYVSHSRQQYEDYQYYLFDLGSDNGGIYIEEDATFYTYQRTEQESYYSLEDLFRHEYVHYLEGRYQKHFSYGEGAFADSPYQHWEVEGLAEYVAGATQYDGIKPRENMMRNFPSDSSEWMTAQEVFEEPSGFKVYPYGMLMHAYMNDHYPDQHQQLFSDIRTDSIESYNALIASLIADSDFTSGYSDFIASVMQDPSNWWDPNTSWLPEQKRSITTVEQVETAYTNAGLAGFTCATYNRTLDNGYQCIVSDMTFASVDSLNVFLNTGLRQLVSDASFEEFNDICYPDSMTDDGDSITANIICEGSLGIGESVNLAPYVTAEADFWLLDGSEASLSVYVFDPEGDQLTYDWVQTSGTPVGNFASTESRTATFKAPIVSVDEVLSFDVTVNDGSNSVVRSVDVQLIQVDYHPPVFSQYRTYFTFYNGEDIVVTLPFINPGDAPLTYRWRYASNNAFTLPIDLSSVATNSFVIDSDQWMDLVSEGTYQRATVEMVVDDGVTETVGQAIIDLRRESTTDNGDTISPELRHQYIDVYGENSVNLEVNASSSLGETVNFEWEQVFFENTTSVDLGLGALTGNQQTIDLSSLEDSDFDENGRLGLYFKVTASDSESQTSMSIYVYVYQNKSVGIVGTGDYGSTIEVENTYIDLTFNSNETILLKVDALSTINAPLTFTWQQEQLDASNTVNLNLGTLAGNEQTIDISGLSTSDFDEFNRVILYFKTQLTDAQSQKTVYVRVYIYNHRAFGDYGETIIVDDENFDLSFDSDEQVLLEINATSTLGEGLSYEWNQLFLDEPGTIKAELDSFTASEPTLDISGLTTDDFDEFDRLVFYFKVTLSDSESLKTVYVYVYVYKASSIEVDESSLSYQFSSSQTISVELGASSSFSDTLTFDWEQVLEEPDTIDLGLGKISGNKQLFDISGLSADDFGEDKRLPLKFAVTISDSFNQKTVFVNIVIDDVSGLANYGDTIEVVKSDLLFEFKSTDDITFAVVATSTLGDSVTYDWVQRLDESDTLDLQLGTLTGAEQTLNISAIQDVLAEKGRLVFNFDVVIKDTQSKRTLPAQIIIDHIETDQNGGGEGEGEGDGGSSNSGNNNSGNTTGGVSSNQSSEGSGGGGAPGWFLLLCIVSLSRKCPVFKNNRLSH